MTTDGTLPAILQPQKRARYLKIIAVFKIVKGLLLLLLGCSLLFLSTRTGWLDTVSDWVDRDILLGHSRPIVFVLNKMQFLFDSGQMQTALQSGKLRATAFLSLFYCAVLLTEGIGVYLQKRWAELLMIFATAGLIPLEIRHIWHRPNLAAFLIFGANCFIVWFLYRVLKREPVKPRVVEEKLVETR